MRVIDANVLFTSLRQLSGARSIRVLLGKGGLQLIPASKVYLAKVVSTSYASLPAILVLNL